ncbi:MAG: RecX family transcriptional regulator [Bacteroidetes bacterium]|nr:RecX family transcriptional regulator [Bacteroidota bacterium]
MTITSIERQKKNRRRVSVFLDGEFAFGLNDDVVFRFGLHKGMTLDDALRRDIERFDNLVQAKLAAERLIALRMRSERELRQRLRQREFSEEAIEETIATFKRVNLLNDAEFARLWVRDRLALRPRSASMLRRELRGKGVHDDIIAEVLAEAFEDREEIDVARALAESYRRKHTTTTGDVLKRRLAGFLQRKGYSGAIVYEIVREMGEGEN